MALLAQIGSSNPGIPPDSYIYKIISTAPQQDPLTYSKTDQLALISSDDSLWYLDATTLQVLPDGIVKSVNEKVTCLERADAESSNVLATAGRDGLVNFWDKRTRRKASEIQSPHKLISALVCDTQKNFIAAGIENPDDGPGISPVYIWDNRNISAPIRSYVDSHTDTVTSLQLHPSHPTLLLSSSTDGLINIFDTSQPEEEDALYQVINHRSAIAHAGFLYPGTDIYAIGTDETLSFHALQSQKDDEEEPAPKVFGDVREVLGCEYLAKMHWVGNQPCVAAGTHSKSLLNLIPITKDNSGPLQYRLNVEKTIQIPGAHGEELVRDLFTDVHTHITWTCGEDGMVRAWKSETEEMDLDDEDEKVKEKKKKDKNEKRKDKKGKNKGEDKERVRYKPY